MIDQSETKAKIARIEGRLSNLIDMRTDGEISKEEYKPRRAKLEAELNAVRGELEQKPEVEPIPQEAKLRWKEIEQTLDQMIDLSGDKVNEDIIDKFVQRVTPLGNNRYAFHMNLDNGATENFIAGVEGKKNSSVIFLDNGTGDGEPSPVLHSICNLRMPKNLDIASLLGDLFFALPTTYCCL